MKTVGYVDMWEDAGVHGPPTVLADPKAYTSLTKSVAKKGNGVLHISALQNYELRIPIEAELLICSEFGNARYKLLRNHAKKAVVLCYEPHSKVPDAELDPCTTLSRVVYLSSRLSEQPDILYVPLFVLYYGLESLKPFASPRPLPAASIPFRDRKDCITLISNTSASYRKTFLEGLMKRVNVDNYGKLFQNATSELSKTCWYDPRLRDLIGQYKCVLTMENTALIGYHTEKIMHGFRAWSVPLYWGDANLSRVVCPEAYVEITQGKEERAYKQIERLCKDEAYWRRMVEAQAIQSDGWRRMQNDFQLLYSFLQN